MPGRYPEDAVDVKQPWPVDRLIMTFQVCSSGLKPEWTAVVVCTVLPLAVTFLALLASGRQSRTKILP